MRGREWLGAMMAILGLCGATVARAQDSNYWSNAYGTRAELLGGVAVGSPGDISSVYYNPGALALVPNTEFLLAGDAFQYQHVSVTNGAGPSRDLVTSSLFVVPSLIAGEIPVFKQDRLAYSYLTRQSVSLDLDERLTGNALPESPLPNATSTAFELGYHQNVSEGWYGLTWSHALTRGLGLGITPEVAVRSQHTTESLFAMGQNAGEQQAALHFDRDFDMSTWRLLARIGLSGVRDSLTYGATLTTPGLGLFGSGGYRQSVNLTDQTGAAGNIFGVSYQEGLTAHYHSPFGAAAGASYGWGTWRVHSAAEWWNKVNSYAALEGEPFTIQTPSGDSTATATVTDELESVFNFGFGLEKHFGNDLAGFASYHTDRSGHPENGGSGASVTAWDLNHVTIGVTFNAFRSTFAIGQSVAFGSRPIQGFALRPDRVPEPDVQTHALILTGTIGWNLAF